MPGGHFHFKEYGPDEGLRDPTFSCIAQDGEGFLWIGTQSGLIRYDGHAFTKYAAPDPLPSSWVFRMRPCREGGLWLCTQAGFVHFLDGRCRPIQVDGRPSKGNSAVVDLDPEGKAWFVNKEGLFRQVGPDAFQSVPGKPKGRSMAIACGPRSTFILLNEALWECSRDGAWHAHGPESGLPAGESLVDLAMDGKGFLWTISARRLFCRRPGESRFQDMTSLLPGPPFSDGAVFKGADGSLCIPSNGGLLRVLGDAVERFDPKAGLPCKWARAGLTDREGNLWVLGAALYRLLGRTAITAHTSVEGLPGGMVWSVLRDRSGRLWAGTNDGLARLDSTGWARVEGTHGLTVCGLAEDPKGRLWIACTTGPVLCLEPGARRPTAQRFKAFRWNGAPPDGAGSLLFDHEGALWMGNQGSGLFRADVERMTASRETDPFVVKGVVEDDRNRIWAATENGLLLREGNTWRTLGKAQGLREDSVQGVTPAGQGAVWVWYSEGCGMERVAWQDGRAKVLETLDLAKGLASNMVLSAVVDGTGTLWVGTDHGLDRIQQGACLHLGRGEGMPGEDICENAVCVDGGYLWQGTSTGLACVRLDRMAALPQSLEARLLHMFRGKQELHPPFASSKPVPHREATLEFHYGVPSYVNEAAVQYQVRLVGQEEEWRTTDLREARYAGLPGGQYRFEVRAAYPGAAFGPVAAYDFEVLPPWWKSAWFFSLVALGGAGLVVLGVHLRLRKLARAKAQLEVIVSERTADLTALNARNLELIEQLQSALAEVRTLRGLIPICCYCKKIRDDQGYWNQMEAYIQSHSEAKFSHGICPECGDKLRKELERDGLLTASTKSLE